MCLETSCHTLPDWAMYALRFCEFGAWNMHGAYAMYASTLDHKHAEIVQKLCSCINNPVVLVNASDRELIDSITSEFIPSGIAVPCVRTAL